MKKGRSEAGAGEVGGGGEGSLGSGEKEAKEEGGDEVRSCLVGVGRGGAATSPHLRFLSPPSTPFTLLHSPSFYPLLLLLLLRPRQREQPRPT